jgi:hypothetical protein
MYTIQGQLSSLPVFWEAVLDGRVVRQISGDGMVCRKRSELPLDQITYWGIVCQQGRYGFDLENQTIIANDIITPCALPENIHELQYRRNIVISSDGDEKTIWVRFGIDDIEIEIHFWPHFQVNLPHLQEKNGYKQGRTPTVAEQLFQTYVDAPTGERARE